MDFFLLMDKHDVAYSRCNHSSLQCCRYTNSTAMRTTCWLQTLVWDNVVDVDKKLPIFTKVTDSTAG